MQARVEALYVSSNDDAGDAGPRSIDVNLEGIAGSSHQTYERETWAGDKQPKGTRRRNERQWSAISMEELAQISRDLDLVEPLTAASVSCNLCLSGVEQFSRLPKGTVLKFPSGAELIVEEYNPPCRDMGEWIAEHYTTQSGAPLMGTAFSKAAKLTRGLVGVVEVPGKISVGDTVEITVYETPSWLVRTAD